MNVSKSSFFHFSLPFFRLKIFDLIGEFQGEKMGIFRKIGRFLKDSLGEEKNLLKIPYQIFYFEFLKKMSFKNS